MGEGGGGSKQGSREKLEEMYCDSSSFGKIVEQGKGKEGFSMMEESNRLMILGKPGAGKTTLMKYSCLQALQGKMDRLPILILLRSLVREELSIQEAILKEFEICHFPEAQPFVQSLLEEGKAFVLLDGLDEVPREHGLRGRIIDELVTFSDRYDRCKLAVTCRSAAEEYHFEGFNYVEMADFDEHQTKTFVGHWFQQNKTEVSAEDFLQELAKKENQRLIHLTHTPILLTLLCLAFQESLSFPHNRTEIYETALNALLEKWDSSRNIERDQIYKGLSKYRKHQMFARIANETFRNSQYMIDQSLLEKKIGIYLEKLSGFNPEEELNLSQILRAIEAQHGLSVQREYGIYSFSHLTFQEYYTARYLTAIQDPQPLQDLVQFMGDDRWQEVFLLTAELLEDADPWLEKMHQKLFEEIQRDSKLIELFQFVEKEAQGWKMKRGKGYDLLNLVLYLFFEMIYSARRIVNSSSTSTNSIRSSRSKIRSISISISNVSDVGVGSISNISSNISSIINSISEPTLRYDQKLFKPLQEIKRNVQVEESQNLDLDTSLWNSLLLADCRPNPLGRKLLHDNFDFALQLARSRGKQKLAEQLQSITLPSVEEEDEETWEVWETLVKALDPIIQEHIDFKFYQYTYEQWGILERFFQRAELFIRCLELANTVHRREWEEKVFSPLESISETQKPQEKDFESSREWQVFISYSKAEESRVVVDHLDASFQKQGIQVLRDQHEIGYKGSIREFMERLGRGKAVILIIGAEYLKSKDCMFELLAIAKQQQFKERIFPLLLPSAGIFESLLQRLKLNEEEF